MAIDKKQQTKQEQRQPETRQETAQAAAAPAGPTPKTYVIGVTHGPLSN
jgi:hypothetical protein